MYHPLRREAGELDLGTCSVPFCLDVHVPLGDSGGFFDGVHMFPQVSYPCL